MATVMSAQTHGGNSTVRLMDATFAMDAARDVTTSDAPMPVLQHTNETDSIPECDVQTADTFKTVAEEDRSVRFKQNETNVDVANNGKCGDARSRTTSGSSSAIGTSDDPSSENDHRAQTCTTHSKTIIFSNDVDVEGDDAVRRTTASDDGLLATIKAIVIEQDTDRESVAKSATAPAVPQSRVRSPEKMQTKMLHPSFPDYCTLPPTPWTTTPSRPCVRPWTAATTDTTGYQTLPAARPMTSFIMAARRRRKGHSEHDCGVSIRVLVVQ